MFIIIFLMAAYHYKYRQINFKKQMLLKSMYNVLESTLHVVSFSSVSRTKFKFLYYRPIMRNNLFDNKMKGKAPENRCMNEKLHWLLTHEYKISCALRVILLVSFVDVQKLYYSNYQLSIIVHSSGYDSELKDPCVCSFRFQTGHTAILHY